MRRDKEFSLVVAFSNRKAGNMSLSYGDTTNSLNNRKIFLGQLGIDYRKLVCAKQVHADNVKLVKDCDIGKGALAYADALDNTDALVTELIGVPLAVFTADCLPVILCDPQKPAVAIVHAGWRSSQQNIVSKTIELMRKEFNVNLNELRAAFGPAMRSCCYEVGGEFKEFFPNNVTEKDAHCYLDLIMVNTKQIIASGVKEENISDCKICTHCSNDNFFSFRKEGKDCGRLMTIAMLQ